MTAVRWMRAGAVSALTLAVLAGLNACFSSPVTGQSDRTLNDMRKSLPAGYEATDTTGGSCGIDYCDFNKRFTMGNITANTIPTECRNLIEWAQSVGATTWYHDSDYIPFPLKGYESNAIIACTMEMTAETPTDVEPGKETMGITKNYLGGTSTAMFGLRGIYPGNDQRSPFDIQFNMNRVPRAAGAPIKRQWGVTVGTTYGDEDPRFTGTEPFTWDAAFAAIPDNSRQLNQILDAVGHYRVTHPNADPYSATSIRAALAGLPKTTKYTLPKMNNGSVRYIFVTSAKDFQSKDGGLCMSLKKFDAKLMEVPDPGTGYTHFSINSFAQDDRFGMWTAGKCPTH